MQVEAMLCRKFDFVPPAQKKEEDVAAWLSRLGVTKPPSEEYKKLCRKGKYVI